VESPVVLTGTGRRFSAGLDLGEHFPAVRRRPDCCRLLVLRLPIDEHAAVHLSAPDGGGSERARVRWRPHHCRGV
jgi:enoyl-CoA hydratase/carnithine racemase